MAIAAGWSTTTIGTAAMIAIFAWLDRRPILAVNNTYGKLRAVNSGLGLASLPDFVAAENSSLVRVLPELSGPPNEAYFVYPEELRSSKRISVFRDFLLRKVAEGRLS